MPVNDCQIINLPIMGKEMGNLTVIEGTRQIPFSIKRIYYIYDIPEGVERGSHAHRNLHQLIIAVSGSFDVVLDDGTNKKLFHMNRSHFGLYVCPMIWRTLNNFSSGAVCLVLASEFYDENDYIRSYLDFKEVLEIQGKIN